MKRIVALFVAISLILMFSACFFETDTEEVIFITSEQSADGNYTLSLYQLGSPRWTFGPVDAKLVLSDRDSAVINEEEFQLFNDGAGVFAGNIQKITWLENRAEILLGESDTTRQFTIILSYFA